MRILTLTNLYPSPWYPHRAAYNRQYMHALSAAGHDVRVIAPIAWTDEWSARRQGKPALPKGRRVTTDGIPVEHPRYYFTPRVLRGSYGRSFRWSVRGAFERAVAEFRPDVVFSSWAYPDGWAAGELAHAAGLPVVVNVVGSDVLFADARRGRVAEAVRRADGVMAASQDLADHVIGMGADARRVRVVYNGVDTGLFLPGDRKDARTKLNLRSDAPLILFVGNLLPVKGLDVLIDALGLLVREGKPFRCHLIGQGPLRFDLERRAAAAGIGDRVTFIGAVAHASLPDWFRAADLFVLPSRSEGVPNVLLEASACGIPYVASNVGGIPEIAHTGRGTLVPPCDARALADAIAKALAAPSSEANGPRVTRSFADAAAEVAEILRDAIRNRAAATRPSEAPAAATPSDVLIGHP
jgi:glycosyltransferase involved in cell wall biosynthesis